MKAFSTKTARSAALGASVSALALLAAPAHAQSAVPDAAAAAAPSGGLEDIVVTARRVEEKLQDVPLSVSAFSAAQVRDQQINQLQDLRAIVPNVLTTRTATAGSSAIAIRGQVSGTLPNISLDQRVGIYLDGVYIARSQGGSFQLADIERLEVLKGPQGTQFGKNVTGGAVNFITANPSGNFGGIAEATVGNNGRMRYRLTVETPEVGGFSIRGTAVHDEFDGDVLNPSGGTSYGRVVNATTGLDFALRPASKRFGGYNTETYFLALRYQNGPFTADLKGDYTDSYEYNSGNQTLGYPANFVGCAAAYLALGLPTTTFTATGQAVNNCGAGAAWPLPLTSAAANQTPVSFTKLDSIPQDVSAPSQIRSRGASLTLNYELSDALTLRSITGYRKLYSRSQLNLAGGNIYIINNNLNLLTGGFAGLPANGITPTCLSCSFQYQNQEQFSEELQLIGNFGPAIDYLVGAYFFKETGYSNNTFVANYQPVNGVFGFGLPPYSATGTTQVPAFAYSNGDDTHINSRSMAVFGRVTWHPTEQFDFVVGARYTGDRKRNIISPTLAGNVDTNPAVAGIQSPPLDRTVSFEKFTYDVTGTYHITPDVNVYARYATAYLAGGLLRNVPFLPETTKAAEIGLKSEFWDRRARFNAAAFWQKSKNIQVATNAPPFGALILDNVGELETTGAEAELTLAPVDALRLNANVGYNHQKFSNAQRNTQPEWTVQLGASYDLFTTDDGTRFTLQGDASYRSAYWGNRFPLSAASDGSVLPSQLWAGRFASQAAYIDALDAATRQGNYWLANARFSISDIPLGGTKATLSVWGRNLFNERHVQYATNFGTTVAGYFEQDRTYGVDVRFAF